MKRMLTLMCVLLIAGCSDDKPQNSLEGAEQNAPQSVAAQERELSARLAEQKKDLDDQTRKAAELEDRLKSARPLLDLHGRWSAARDELSQGKQAPVTEQLQRVEALKSEAENAAVDSCSIKGRNSLVESMTLTLGVMNQLAASKGKPDATVQESVDRAYALQQQAESQLRECAQ